MEMKHPIERNARSRADRAALRLLGIAIVLAAIAVAADVAWLLPRVAPLDNHGTAPAAATVGSPASATGAQTSR